MFHALAIIDFPFQFAIDAEESVDCPGEFFRSLGHLIFELAIEFEYASLRSLDVGQIVDDARVHTLIVHNHFTHCQANRKDTSILSASFHFPTDTNDESLSGFVITLEVAIMFFVVRAGHEHFHVLADNLLGVIAKKCGGCRIDMIDDTALIDRDDTIDGRLDNCLQTQCCLINLLYTMNIPHNSGSSL